MTGLVKASKAVKSVTATVRTHLDAVERAREIYLAQIRRAESEYFERIKKATEIITDAADPQAAATEAPPSTPETSPT